MQNEKRQCQPCTACCEGHLELGEALQPKGKSDQCKHCTSSGCGMYHFRPIEPCQQFECLWLVKNSSLPQWMRPDESRVIVTLNRLKKTNQPVLVALQMDEKTQKRTTQWLQEFSSLYKIPLAMVQKSKIKEHETSDELFNLEFL